MAFLPPPCVTALLLSWRLCCCLHPIAAERAGEHRGGRGASLLQALGFLFYSDLSNNKISSLSNSSFTNMSQLTTL